MGLCRNWTFEKAGKTFPPEKSKKNALEKTFVGKRLYFSEVLFRFFFRGSSLVRENERFEAQMHEPASNNEDVDGFLKTKI